MKVKYWTTAEEEELKIMSEMGMRYKEIAKVLGRTETTIRTRCSQKGLRRIKKWTPEDIQFILDNPKMKNQMMARKLNCSVSAIYTKRKKVATKG